MKTTTAGTVKASADRGLATARRLPEFRREIASLELRLERGDMLGRGGLGDADRAGRLAQRPAAMSMARMPRPITNRLPKP